MINKCNLYELEKLTGIIPRDSWHTKARGGQVYFVEKDGKTMKEYTLRVREGLAYMPYAPVLFISALTGQRVDKLYEMIVDVYEQNRKRIPTGQLNSILAEATARVQPPTDKGKRLKIYYMTQASTKPPTFVIFVNDAELFHFSYQRYIENKLREVFGFSGTPIRIVVRQKGDEPYMGGK